MRAFSAWTGRTQQAWDVVEPGRARLMAATLDRPDAPGPGDPLPPLWHWMLFPPETPTAALGPDGHPARGGFLPPVLLERRMWAGGRIAFHRPLPVGAAVARNSEILSVTEKNGRSGPLCFVTVRHRIDTAEGPALTEEHDIVYLGTEAAAVAAPAPPGGAQISRQVTPSMPLLFRYSALTFNAHRIHYDIDHCRRSEGYPGCVVHGPLIATLLAGLAQEMWGARPLARFDFRATAPLFHDAPFTLCARRGRAALTLWAETPGGDQAMCAEAA